MFFKGLYKVVLKIIFFCFLYIKMFRFYCCRSIGFWYLHIALYVVEYSLALASTHLFFQSVQALPVPLGSSLCPISTGVICVSGDHCCHGGWLCLGVRVCFLITGSDEVWRGLLTGALLSDWLVGLQ